MPLLDRVATLIRANLNDLIDKAEEPEKLLKQLLQDLQNQFMQVKTQVAIAIADQHLLEKKKSESLESQRGWIHKAEIAIAKGEDDLARAALERSLSHENAVKNFSQQIEDQTQHVHILRDALHRLEQKMIEAKTKTELLVAQHRRARMAARAGTASWKESEGDALWQRAQSKVVEADAVGRAYWDAAEPGIEQKLAALERADRVEKLLNQIKARKAEGQP